MGKYQFLQRTQRLPIVQWYNRSRVSRDRTPQRRG